MDQEVIRINHDVRIPLAELRFRFSRSSGPGGQHVQKTSTRVELLFDVATSPSLTEAQRSRVRDRLAGYVDQAGMLRLAAQSERSQWRNREEVLERFEEMMRQALKQRKHRKKTRPSAASREKRLRKKHKRSETKKTRGRVRGDE